MGAFGVAVGWSTALQAGKSRVPFRWCHWNFSLRSTEIITRENFLVGKGGWGIGLTTLQSSSAECLGIWVPHSSFLIWGTNMTDFGLFCCAACTYCMVQSLSCTAFRVCWGIVNEIGCMFLQTALHLVLRCIQIRRAPLKRLAPSDGTEELANHDMPRPLEWSHAASVVLKCSTWVGIKSIEELEGRGKWLW
jgi:hypothetical protein